MWVAAVYPRELRFLAAIGYLPLAPEVSNFAPELPGFS
jgi:hypothetical protein